jgi:hypothetical protein
MPMFGYALALFAQARGEAQPSWAEHLRPDVRTEFTKSCRFLAQALPRGGRPTVMPPFPGTAPTAEAEEAELEHEEEEALPDTWSAEEVLKRYAAGVRDFREAELQGVVLRGADLSGCDLTGADLSAADLTEADLTECNLGGAELRGAILQGAVLQRANLRGADLSLANLRSADLDGADLRGADLAGAVLRWARVLGTAYNSGTDFTGVDFSEVVFDAALGKEVQRRAARKEMFAGDFHATWRWPIVGLAVIAMTCTGGLGGGMLGALGDGFLCNAFGKGTLTMLGSLVGTVWFAKIAIRKLVWPGRR